MILSSILHYQIFEFNTNIQILVWIIGNIQKRRNFEANLACQQAIFFFTVTRDTHGTRSGTGQLVGKFIIIGTVLL